MAHFIRASTFALLLLAMVSASARAADAIWTLTDAEFRQQPVTIKSIAPDRMVFTSGHGELTLDRVDFLSVERPPGGEDAAGDFALLLISGDTLYGTPGGVVSGRLTWKSAAFGEVAVKLSDCQAMVRRKSEAPVNQMDQKRVEDLIGFANGDAQKGFVADVDKDKIVLEVGDAKVSRELSAIAYVLFASAARPAATAASAMRVRLGDGSSLTADDVLLKEENLIISSKGAENRSVPMSAVAGIEQLNGPVAWLSARTPTSAEQINFAIEHPESFPTRMNCNVEGRPIRFGRLTYARGIGVHAKSIVTFNIDPAYPIFRTQFAVDPDQPRTDKADVTVRIKVDEKIAHEVKHFRGGRLAEPVFVDVAGGKRLTLEVDFGANAETQDRFNWIEPAFIKHKPAAPASAPAVAEPATTRPTVVIPTEPTSEPAALPASAPTIKPATTEP